jgi:UDP-N-acetylmuramoyl-L-alanyl-D-glutamate--2,6-diaminopimelate ligase
VLGSAGGGRDKWKRPVLGKLAAEHCDAIVITNEDPFDEDPKQIMREIEGGVRDHPRFDRALSLMTYQIEDRREAVRTAIELARKGDTVVVTGKGSEEWIRVARGKRIPWSDAVVARKILAGKKP